MKAPSPTTVKVTLLVFLVMALVIVPFLLFGEGLEAAVQPWLEAREDQTVLLTVVAIALLAADSVAPVPATLVIMFLAWKAGWVAGLIGGTLGMCAGVLAAGWIGRTAVGRIAPKFLPDSEIARLGAALQRRLGLTLACWRSVPVMAETSVIMAAALGVPVKRIFWATVLPNFAVAAIYSFAAAWSQNAKESGAMAAGAFFATLLLSVIVWLVAGRREMSAQPRN